VQALEGVGSPAARAALKVLAGGAAEDPLTRAAGAALARLAKRPAAAD
jgi:hypothetical protein